VTFAGRDRMGLAIHSGGKGRLSLAVPEGASNI
jgi:hypothetical protein